MIKVLNSMNVYPVLLLVLILLRAMTSKAGLSDSRCVASSCGNIHNITQPFRLKSDPRGCGEPNKELICEDDHTVWYLNHGRFYVQSINYSTHLIKLVDDGLQKDNCSSLPHHSLVLYDPINLYRRVYYNYSGGFYFNKDILAIVNCSKPVSSPLYISTGPCNKGLYSSNKLSNWNLYALVKPKVSDVKDFCTISRWTLASTDLYNSSYNNELIHNIMADGFDVTFYDRMTWKQTLLCYFDLHSIYTGQVCVSFNYDIIGVADYAIMTAWDFTFLLVYFCLVKFAIGTPFVATFLIYNYRRRHLANDKNIEECLQAYYNNYQAIRYSYSNIKKITRNFKHKLGEGAHGFVYKGMLRSGNEVAIKILKQSKACGQQFISEVATIGRIHHVNIVRLIGFCSEGSKQALVYDLMSNGSLDKHIFTDKGDSFLDYRKIYEIALGVARGIEYLHRWCDMQILHFDIKPQNILLDKNFTPKVSGFGLARLYPIGHSIVSLTVARGTIEYMAPELLYPCIGGVSYKADIYSFGMLLMEMVSRRRNLDRNVEHSSQIYFPLWVYDQVNKGKSLEMEEVVEEERNVIKKMIIVALWCIQLNPDHRPPMNKVLEMLEGDIDELEMPPKPLLYISDELINNDKSEMELEMVELETIPETVELETVSTSSSSHMISASIPFGDSNNI